MSCHLGIWRLMFRKPEPPESKYWKMSRQVMWKALTLGADETGKKQREMFVSAFVSIISTISVI